MLCQSIIGAIGKSEFKSKQYIDAYLCRTYIYDANALATGGYISGEVGSAITIRLLAGGDTLDLSVTFDIYPTHLATIMKEVLIYWIIKLNIGKINMIKHLNNVEVMNRVRCRFSRRSNGVLKGCIGAIDGWLAKITRPNL